MSSRWSADALVIFGITGDLARRMTIPALYDLESRGALDCPIIGVASRPLDPGAWREHLRFAVTARHKIDEAVFTRLVQRSTYIAGDMGTGGLYDDLNIHLAHVRRPLVYLEVPPHLYGVIISRLHAVGLINNAHIAVEKPFGSDLASARELRSALDQVLGPDQLLLVDHFLGKEPVIEIEYLRFANFAMAELWDRTSVKTVQITMAEDIGVDDRARFYDPVGALRDVVQNHLLQVLALVAMDPPVGPDPDDLRDKKYELLRTIPAVQPRSCVRGQYAGYRSAPSVPPRSETETFVALELAIDNWRWAGVPVFVRAGKRMPTRVTEVRLVLHDTPRLRFLPDATKVQGNAIVLRIDPSPGVRLQVSALDERQAWKPIHLDTLFEHELGKPRSPYERLLYDALRGEDRLFARHDAVSECWRIIEPIIDYPPPVSVYDPGTWGPAQADDLVSGYPPWQTPWVPGDR